MWTADCHGAAMLGWIACSVDIPTAPYHYVHGLEHRGSDVVCGATRPVLLACLAYMTASSLYRMLPRVSSADLHVCG